MDSSLYMELKKYGEKDIYPFHMPGHKRNPVFQAGFFPVEQDITEITGFDDLHHAEGLIREAREFAAELYGSKEVFFSVNGSTAAILSAVSAAVKKGGKLLTARNSHKSLYNAMYLRDLEPVYVYPETDPYTGISCSISPSWVDRLLEENKDIEAVFITSPTYDGIVSNIKEIADVSHRHSVPLIVDEAHGAHFHFSEYFPSSAVTCGADLVIHSIHKTLPSLTQTAVLHICSDRICRDKTARFMSIYQSSSPSYPLMASLDYCMRFLKENGREWFSGYTDRLRQLRQGLGNYEKIRLMDFKYPRFSGRGSIYDFDRSKILLTSEQCGIAGNELLNIFHDRYGLEMEMASAGYVIALTSVGDTQEGFCRLLKAVSDMEKNPEITIRNTEEGFGISGKTEKPVKTEKPEILMKISDALEAKSAAVPLEESIGRISAEFMYLYPPGIPLVVPGEQISLQFVKNMRRYIDKGMNIAGLRDCSGKSIQCVF